MIHLIDFYLQRRGHIIEIRKLTLGLEKELICYSSWTNKHGNSSDPSPHRNAECVYVQLLLLWDSKTGQSPGLTDLRQSVSSYLSEGVRACLRELSRNNRERCPMSTSGLDAHTWIKIEMKKWLYRVPQWLNCRVWENLLMISPVTWYLLENAGSFLSGTVKHD